MLNFTISLHHGLPGNTYLSGTLTILCHLFWNFKIHNATEFVSSLKVLMFWLTNLVLYYTKIASLDKSSEHLKLYQQSVRIPNNTGIAQIFIYWIWSPHVSRLVASSGLKINLLIWLLIGFKNMQKDLKLCKFRNYIQWVFLVNFMQISCFTIRLVILSLNCWKYVNV